MSAARGHGAKLVKLLPVSVPSHCQLMSGAAEQFKARLQQVVFEAPVIDVIHNADLASHTEESLIKDRLLKQLTRPVPWVETINHMVLRGVDCFIECGPGAVLQGLIKRINKQVKYSGLSSIDTWETANQLVEEDS